MRQLDMYDCFVTDRPDSGLECKDVSLAVQSQRDESDINTIVKRFGLTGVLPQGIRMPTWGDFDVAIDYQSALNALIAARQSFEAMPASVRSRFSNDPGAFVDFCSDEANRDEAIRLGLVIPAPVVVAVPLPIVAPGAPGAVV